MSFSPAPSQADVQTVLRSFLLAILPAGTECVAGQDNRVPEPHASSFVVMTTILRKRLETNVDTYQDCAFTASIAAGAMTVTAVQLGVIAIGNTLLGLGVTAGTTITAQTAGPPGGAGTYTVSPSQTLGARTLASGQQTFTQPTEVTIQLDVHSASVGAAADMAQTITTLFRDNYAVEFFAALNANVAPLYADDPRQVPFINAESQYETRYVVDVHVQANQAVSASQDFADVLGPVDVISVEAAYPASP